MKEHQKGSLFELDGTIPLTQALPFGIQHVLAMFLGNISPVIIIVGLLQLSADMGTTLIQNAMFVSGMATLLQIYPIFRVGAGLPIVMGTSSGFLGTAKSIGAEYGYPGIMGATLVGSLVQILLGFFIKPLRKFFPPIVTSLVVISIGLNLVPVGARYLGGGAESTDFGSWRNLLAGAVVLTTIILVNQSRWIILKSSAVLIGITAGYLISIPLGMVDFTQLANAAWFSMPKPLLSGFEFHPSAIIAMIIMYFASSVETVGNISSITENALNREPKLDEIRGGVLGDGVGCLMASFFSILPNTCFSQNAGLVSVTRIVNRFTVMTGAVLLVLAGFIPKFSAIFSIMPKSVLGGAAMVMFSMILVNGIKALLKTKITDRDSLIIAVSLGLGVGIGNVPQLVSQLPSWVSQVFAGNSVVTTFFIAAVMNLALPVKENKD